MFSLSFVGGSKSAVGSAFGPEGPYPLADLDGGGPNLGGSKSAGTPALIQKQSLRIVILKAVCRFVVLLLSTFSGFSIFSAGFSFAFDNFARYFVVLLNVPLSDRGEKKDTCLQWVTFPEKSRSVVDPRRSRYPIGLRFQEAR